MERAAFVALAVVALAAVLQAGALVAILLAARRIDRRLARTAADNASWIEGAARHLSATAATAAVVSGSAAAQVRTLSGASARVRADAAVTTARAAHGTRSLVALVWALAPLVRSLQDGVQVYQAARPRRAAPVR